MAKKRAAAPVRSATTSVESVAAAKPATVQIVEVPAGGTAVVIVDVGPMTVPYTVTYAGTTVINKSFVDRAQMLNLLPGDQVLGWAFVHMTKGWHHKIGVSINDETPVILESMSEAKKDEDHSVKFAIIRLGAQ